MCWGVSPSPISAQTCVSVVRVWPLSAPKRTRVHNFLPLYSASRHARDDLPVEEQVDDQRRDGDQKDVHETSASTISTNNTPRSGLLLDGFRRFRGFERCQGVGLHVPGDVKMGHDNTAFCDLSIASMTSIDQSGPELGANAARLLIERIEGRTKSVFVTVAPKVVARGSTKMPRVEIAAQSKITGTEDIERFPRPRDNIPSRVR